MRRIGSGVDLTISGSSILSNNAGGGIGVRGEGAVSINPTEWVKFAFDPDVLLNSVTLKSANNEAYSIRLDGTVVDQGGGPSTLFDVDIDLVGGLLRIQGRASNLRTGCEPASFRISQLQFTTVREPGTLGLLGAGLICLGFMSRKRA